jgi:hypothetical protein
MAEYKKTPSLKDIYKSVMKSQSLSEAVQKINKFKSTLKGKKSSPVKVKESISNGKPSWLPKGRI